MHSIVRRFIKTGIVFLAVGIAIGLAGVVQRELWQRWPSPYHVSAHTHAILVGFVMMMIQGVALWLFPRPDRDDSRYDPRVVALSWWAMTLGTILRVGGDLGRGWSQAPLLRAAVVSGALLQVAGMGLFFYTMWSRVRAVGSAAREARGERF